MFSLVSASPSQPASEDFCPRDQIDGSGRQDQQAVSDAGFYRSSLNLTGSTLPFLLWCALRINVYEVQTLVCLLIRRSANEHMCLTKCITCSSACFLTYFLK